ncbi:hypothetical protein [Alteromonas sp. CYL-A6]|uniref:hypothetical protein n=1 Tax=Alteromonas nitratireducens TaxID=3390813 RepID=UPI0034BC1DFE
MFTKHRWLEIFVIFMLLVPHGQAGADVCECNEDDSVKTHANLSHASSGMNPDPQTHYLKAESEHCASHCDMCDPEKCLCCEGGYTGFHLFALSPIDGDIWFQKAFSFSSITTKAQSLAPGFSIPPYHPPISC